MVSRSACAHCELLRVFRRRWWWRRCTILRAWSLQWLPFCKGRCNFAWHQRQQIWCTWKQSWVTPSQDVNSTTKHWSSLGAHNNKLWSKQLDAAVLIAGLAPNISVKQHCPSSLAVCTIRLSACVCVCVCVCVWVGVCCTNLFLNPFWCVYYVLAVC